LIDCEYSIDWAKRQVWGAIGMGRSLRGNWLSGIRLIWLGVGWPVISVSRPTALWK